MLSFLFSSYITHHHHHFTQLLTSSMKRLLPMGGGIALSRLFTLPSHLICDSLPVSLAGFPSQCQHVSGLQTLDFLSSLTTLTPRSVVFAPSMLRAPKFIISCLTSSLISISNYPLSIWTVYLTCISNIAWLKQNSSSHPPYHHSPSGNLSFRPHTALRVESWKVLVWPPLLVHTCPPSVLPSSPVTLAYGPFLNPSPVCFGAFTFSLALAWKALGPGLGIVRSFSAFRS